MFSRPVGKNTRRDYELISQLGKLASGRLEAKCFFRPVVFFSDRSGLAEAFYYVSRSGRSRPVGKNTRPFSELISQLGKLASGRPEAERFFRPFRFYDRSEKTDSYNIRKAYVCSYVNCKCQKKTNWFFSGRDARKALETLCFWHSRPAPPSPKSMENDGYSKTMKNL